MLYRVTWEIDVFDAESHEDAARKAMKMLPRDLSDQDDGATIFGVIPCDEKGTPQYQGVVYVDLAEPENED